MAKTFHGEIWRSPNEGLEWNRVIKNEIIVYVVTHDFDTKRVLIFGISNIDGGNRFMVLAVVINFTLAEIKERTGNK